MNRTGREQEMLAQAAAGDYQEYPVLSGRTRFRPYHRHRCACHRCTRYNERNTGFCRCHVAGEGRKPGRGWLDATPGVHTHLSLARSLYLRVAAGVVLVVIAGRGWARAGASQWRLAGLFLAPYHCMPLVCGPIELRRFAGLTTGFLFGGIGRGRVLPGAQKSGGKNVKELVHWLQRVFIARQFLIGSDHRKSGTTGSAYGAAGSKSSSFCFGYASHPRSCSGAEFYSRCTGRAITG